MFDAESKKLALKIITYCSDHAIKIAVAESCTGGLISAALTSIAGASTVFERGFVTYSNASKEQLLSVSPITLETFGAVSAESVKEMAFGAQKASQAELAIAVSGIAGPAGGTEEKPVGLVYIAWAREGGRFKVRKFMFKGNRDHIRQGATQAALSMILIEVGAMG